MYFYNLIVYFPSQTPENSSLSTDKSSDKFIVLWRIKINYIKKIDTIISNE
jgi:hypothetical protein